MPEGFYWKETDVERAGRVIRAFEAGPGGGIAPVKRALPDRNYTRIQFRNDFAGTIPAYGVCRVTGADTVDDVPVLTVDRPDTSFNRLYLVNGDGDVAEDGFGWGTFLWHADWVLYDDASTPAFGESWGPQNGSFELKKWRYGFTIWGEPSGGTTDIVLASQHWVDGFLCKSNEEFAADGGTGGVSVYDGNQADTSIDVSGCVNRTSLTFANDDWGKATWLGGNWFVEPWEC